MNEIILLVHKRHKRGGNASIILKGKDLVFAIVFVDVLPSCFVGKFRIYITFSTNLLRFTKAN